MRDRRPSLLIEPRIAARRRRRRAYRRGTLGLVALLVVAVAAVGLVPADGFLRRALDLAAPAGPDALDRLGAPSATLLVTYEGDALTAAPMVLAMDPATSRATVLLVPPATVVEVPGHGAFPLDQAHELGGVALVAVSLANALGVWFDAATGVRNADWVDLVDRVGGARVEVRSPLEAQSSGRRFAPGVQHLDGSGWTDLLTLRQVDETQLEALPRVQHAVAALLDRLAADPEVLAGGAYPNHPSDGRSGSVPGDDRLVAAALQAMALARAEDRLTTLTLPVVALGTGREDRYRLDGPRVEELVADRLTAARPSAAVGDGHRVQVLNGNGVPRIGPRVAELLGDGGYRVVLSGNADRFDYQTTRIILHAAGPDVLEVAEDVRRRLGVGAVERAGIPQSVVDLTIVVGADFPP